MKRIAVLTAGGDAPGMNPAILAVVKVAVARGIEVVGVRRGYDGLIDGDFESLTRGSQDNGVLTPTAGVDEIAGLGGTYLGSSRSRRFYEAPARALAADRMREHGVEGLVVIGGNGSQAGAHHLTSEQTGIRVVGIPATIDNDIGGTSEAIGVDTALNTIIEACDRVVDTARSHRRAIIVEVMGRLSGYLAMAAAVASAADAVLLPEVATDDAALVSAVESVVKRNLTGDRGKNRVLIIKAEGVPVPATRLAREVQTRLADYPDIEVRATVLGYLVRGGRPSFRDRMMSGRLASAAVNGLVDGMDDVMVAWNATTVDSVATGDSRVYYCPLGTVLAESSALEDGSSEVTARRVLRMQEIQGVLAL